MDAPTMALLLKGDETAVRHFGQVGEVQTLLLPNPTAGGTAVLRPTILPINPLLAQRLAQWAGDEQTVGEISYTTLPPRPRPAPQVAQSATFGGELQLLGVDVVTTAATLELISYWRVVGSPTAERRFFLHQVDAATGELLHQHDALSAPTQFWQVGDLIWQYHTLPTAAPPFELRLGVYEPAPPWPRLHTATGEEFVVIRP
jgi:hypothetical protein